MTAAKRTCAQALVERGVDITSACKLADISRATYYRPERDWRKQDAAVSTMDKWVKQLRAAPEGRQLKGAPVTPEQQRIRELEKKIKRIETENEILKKATALLMSDSLNNLR